MNIEDPNSDKDGKCDKQHGEEQVLAKQRYSKRSWWNNLGKQQEEHSQREKD